MRPAIYPWSELEPGDEFFVAAADRGLSVERLYHSLRQRAHHVLGPGNYRAIKDETNEGVLVRRLA